MKLISAIAFIFSLVFFSSCGTQKQLPPNYIQNTTDTSGKNISELKNIETLIQPNDELSIVVYSKATDEKTDALYNLPSGNGGTVGSVLVDAQGNIHYPRIGVIHAAGLTKRQLEEQMKSKLTELTDPTVIIRFTNFRITVLGEVGHQGTFSVPYEKLTIFEALGLSGDIPLTGRKDNVTIIREADGKREIGTVDLTSKNVFESPYYNLKQNDVVIVDITKKKIRQEDRAETTARIQLGLSLIAAAGIIYNLIKK